MLSLLDKAGIGPPLCAKPPAVKSIAALWFTVLILCPFCNLQILTDCLGWTHCNARTPLFCLEDGEHGPNPCILFIVSGA